MESSVCKSCGINCDIIKEILPAVIKTSIETFGSFTANNIGFETTRINFSVSCNMCTRDVSEYE